jgi:hypothetical protein
MRKLEGIKVLLVDGPKPSTREPDVKVVDILGIFTLSARFQGVGFSTINLICSCGNPIADMYPFTLS